ncbi:protein kinase [Chitinophaga sp. SYP-B3965]|uniref:lanthionine synthetase LanC family protein n=1 Tax=Chitinophaga sp. SYP-B3965 TaxID=2663120 RepID=UPI001299905A|nr:lanthionine synthetase LanC family protein [Chitinophaga sp. SYP-B3965]MRG47689.1 protein kinase [Chitinophaga sp. SYP-B3965]
MIDNNRNTTVEEIIDTAEKSTFKGKAEKKAGKRIGYNYIIIKSLKESQKNDVVKCFYIKSLFDFGTCVIKEGTYGDTKDAYGRDIRDRLIWQRELHELLQNNLRIPRLLGSFEENGNYYLVIERIKGSPLGKILKKGKRQLRTDLINKTKRGLQFIDYLIQIYKLIQRMHNFGIIHRDITVNNFIIMPGGRVAVIDLELSYSMTLQYPSPPFLLGTRGYMSPEQENASQNPSEKEDIYSLGMLTLQSWAGISAYKLNDVKLEDITRKVSYFIPDKRIAEIVTKCIHPDPEERPNINNLLETIAEYKNDAKKNIIRPSSIKKSYTKEEIILTVQESISTFGSTLLCNKEKGWFSEIKNKKPKPEKDKMEKAWYGSFSIGVAGIIYFLSIAKKAGIDISKAEYGIQKAWELIYEKYNKNIDKSGIGLLNGSDGIAFVLSHALKNGLLSWSSEHIEWMERLLSRESTTLILSSGLSGQGIANLACQEFLPAQVQEKLKKITTKIIENQQSDGGWSYGKRRTKGFNNGAAGVIYFLIEVGKLNNNTEALKAAKNGLKWLISQAKNQGETCYWVNSKGKTYSNLWSEGVIGISFTFLKAFEYFQDPIYRQYAINSLNFQLEEQHPEFLNQMTGLVGKGHVYLEAFLILKEEKWLTYADKITQTIMHLKKTHPLHGPYWLTEDERQPVGNFFKGISGLLYYLLRYCDIANIKPPF